MRTKEKYLEHTEKKGGGGARGLSSFFLKWPNSKDFKFENHTVIPLDPESNHK